MSCESEAAPPHKCPAGIPPWVLTFADLMSLLLAFFVLLFSFSEMDSQKYKQVAGSMADAFGVQREVHVKDPPKGINIIATEFSAGVPQDRSVNELKQITTDDFRQYLKIPKLTDARGKEAEVDPNRVVTVPKPSAEFTDALQKEKHRLETALQEEIRSGYVEIEIRDRNIIVRIQERGSFASGSNLLFDPFRKVLAKMARTIGSAPGAVIVAGHTDSVPIHNELFRSNWDLSASRAVTVVHVLMQEGSIPENRFQVEGFGDTRPLDSNDTPEGRAHNRRVEVELHYDESLVGTLKQMPANPARLPDGELFQHKPAADAQHRPVKDARQPPHPRHSLSWAEEYSLESRSHTAPPPAQTARKPATQQAH
jgi:chemotaxis protein MotB